MNSASLFKSNAIDNISPMENMIPVTLSKEELDNTKELFKPKSGCGKCHGRGYKGIMKNTEKYVLCKCLRKKMANGVADIVND